MSGIGVGIALMGSPQLVFLDEPSTGVDPGARRFMWDIISRLSTHRKECTVVLTTHNMEEAEALCSSIGETTLACRQRLSSAVFVPE